MVGDTPRASEAELDGGRAADADEEARLAASYRADIRNRARQQIEMARTEAALREAVERMEVSQNELTELAGKYHEAKVRAEARAEALAQEVATLQARLGIAPAYKPKKGKGFSLTARITAELRAALVAESERTGRSISQVAELWMEAGEKVASGEDATGDPEVGPALRTMGRLAMGVQYQAGKPSEELAARDSILAAWRDAAIRMLPVPPPTEDEYRAAAADHNLQEALDGLVATGWCTEEALNNFGVRGLVWHKYTDRFGKQDYAAFSEPGRIEGMVGELFEELTPEAEALYRVLAAVSVVEDYTERYTAKRERAAKRGSAYARVLELRSNADAHVSGHDPWDDDDQDRLSIAGVDPAQVPRDLRVGPGAAPKD